MYVYKYVCIGVYINVFIFNFGDFYVTFSFGYEVVCEWLVSGD